MMRLLLLLLSALALAGVTVVVGEEPPSCTNDEDEMDESLASLIRAKFQHNPSILLDIKQKLHEGKLVVIKDALPVELAEQVHHDLDSIPWQQWPLNQDCLADGFCYSHHNVYEWSTFTSTMNRTLNIFEHDDTKEFLTQLSGRNCYGNNTQPGKKTNPTGTPSWYMPGDFSLPHTDHIGPRTVAYVWHLSKSWNPQWGGALFWSAQNDFVHDSYHHASFNTLVLFSVTTHSTHFVTTVSPKSEPHAKRLTFNGWWTTDWRHQGDDQVVYERLTSNEPLADQEWMDIQHYLQETKQHLDPQRHHQLTTLYEDRWSQSFLPSTAGVYQ